MTILRVFKSRPVVAAAAIAAVVAVSAPAVAHRAWMLPSATVLSGDDVWVTVDAASSNDLFYFEHHPMRLDNLAVFSPDGKQIKAENIATGRYRSTFDVKLSESGTYKMAIVNDSLFASYRVDGQVKRMRGATPEKIEKEIPKNATDVRVQEVQSRMEIFVTQGKPSDTVLKPTGRGLELTAITHPNNLVAGEKAEFRLLLDGQPAKGVEVDIIPGGIRYRDKLNDVKVKTSDDGMFSFTWPEPGMYWINAGVRDDKASYKDAQRRASYTATLEVMAP
ncbi:MAG TPA: DUF4198 domain-containing protein [Xanthobacteraceae bacterium]|nr:DUF4198 domain-containing protein [Xanthobacteraceae bacterium]